MQGQSLFFCVALICFTFALSYQQVVLQKKEILDELKQYAKTKVAALLEDAFPICDEYW